MNLWPNVKRWPDLFQLTSLYGAVLAKLGQDLAAYQALQHAHQLNPQDPETTNLLYLTTFELAKENLGRRARGNIPSRCAIWKKRLRCGLRRLSRTAAWLKSIALPATPRGRKPSCAKRSAWHKVQISSSDLHSARPGCCSEELRL